MALEVINTNDDSVKRGKLLSLSLIIALSIFIQTIVKINEGDVFRTVSTAMIYLVVSFLGLIWAFNFQVKIRSLPFLLQSSLFVMSEYLFIQLFFVQKFSRIYEGLILLVLVAMIFVGTYVSFLMANVFNVNLYKSIPLVHVGRTTSYIISTFSVFFITFGLLSLQLPVYILIPLVIGVSVFLSFIHLKNLGYEGVLIFRKTFLVSLIVIFMFIGSFLTGVLHELSALSPTVGYFAGIGIANMRSIDKSKNWEMLLYILALIIVIVVNIKLNVFS
ncbi:hypothetical protein A3K02_00205 [candidate division WS6 bacterium RIFOXYD1_FULL_33_8]|uniref:Uncharacterized protein n=2 Tax=Candidatus Dojkabacteria TaxID=74243 RepID=A0A0G0DJC5_9BACT|nr:MAG: hypothetical protein UR32_C0003G0049 [candidate division WS6 bacterium GW2011_GWE2_33_157]KKP44659.1 MAG: hypothetical protein UR34_C0001G0005 [candidate division WS6 bacterium GW2011_GWC1_33_20]KKP46001.1 MAG: hypothetical protein UR36_C0002G0043 [candidate division WS6 bacterium GW2011_GWF1_33_233]KKP55487.1 MAG: hypothetical protein UR47_C0001G0048 [candidate division WS6 bacterium GW2011_GWB1_33_6]KKP55568.1 MAG: hypothetical protein UR45_C0001G0050 [candidate division WS6 bacterium